jgi:transcriptional regulator with XRE-family HTH domain
MHSIQMPKKLHFRRPENVGKRLALTRLALGFPNQKEFYSSTRLGASAYSMWESGDSFPRVEHMMLLCQQFGLTLDWIYRGDLSGLPYGLATKIRAETAKDSTFIEALDFSTIEMLP